MPVDYHESKEATWNSAQECARRLGYWIQLANEHFYNKKYLNYYDCLLIVYREISSKLTEEEFKKLNEKIKDLRKEENKFNDEIKKHGIDEEIEFTSKFPIMLHNFDVLLRRYADKHNLLIPSKKSIFDSEDE